MVRLVVVGVLCFFFFFSSRGGQRRWGGGTGVRRWALPIGGGGGGKKKEGGGEGKEGKGGRGGGGGRGGKGGREDMKPQKHDRALKKVTELKNKARREFRQAKRQGSAKEEIQSLARNFFDLVWQQSALKKRSKQDSETRSAKAAREHYYKHFWKFTRELLDDNAASKVTPEFSKEETFRFFSDTYSSTPKEFEKPDWMPTPRPPEVEFEVDLILPDEVRAVIKRSKSASSPSPFHHDPLPDLQKMPFS